MQNHQYSSLKFYRLTKMFEKLESVCWQNYLDWPEFENWSDDSARIVLLGEAARPLVVRTLSVLFHLL
jgi:hypothetical protein